MGRMKIKVSSRSKTCMKAIKKNFDELNDVCDGKMSVKILNFSLTMASGHASSMKLLIMQNIKIMPDLP